MFFKPWNRQDSDSEEDASGEEGKHRLIDRTTGDDQSLAEGISRVVSSDTFHAAPDDVKGHWNFGSSWTPQTRFTFF